MRNKLLVALALATSVALLGATAVATRALTPERLKWMRAFVAASDQPLFRLWLEQVVEEVREAGLLERLDKGSDTSAPGRELAVARSFVLTFPHNANGTVAGLRFKSSVILLNNSETNANGTAFFYQSNGTPLNLTTNRGAGNQFAFALQPGEIYKLETDGSGPLSTGWVEVVSDIQLSGTATFAVFSSTGQFLSEVGVADSPRSRTLMILVDTRDGKNTAYAVANPNRTAQASVKAELKQLSGTLVGSKDFTLGPQAQRPEFVTETFPGVSANFQGILVLSSANTELSMVTLRTRGLGFTSLPSASRVTDTSRAGSLLFGRIADGIAGGLRFTSTFGFLNNSDKAANVTLDLVTNTGSELKVRIGNTLAGRFNFQVPAGGGVELVTDGSAETANVGWAQASSDIPLAGSALFTLTNRNSGQFVSEAGVPDSPRSSTLQIFAEVKGDIDTALGLTNPDSFSKNVTLRLIGGASSAAGDFSAASEAGPAAALPVLAEKEILLGARSHDGRFVTEHFSGVPEVRQRNFEGRVEVESSNIGGITLRTRGALFTSLPVAAFKPAAFAPKLVLSASTLLERSRPAIYFTYSQNAEEAVLAKVVFKTDQGRLDFSKIRSQQVIGQLIQEAFGFLATGYLFATNVTAESCEFYTAMTLNGGTLETDPIAGRLSNNSGGGFSVQMNVNPVNLGEVPIKFDGTLCFYPDLIQMPAGSALVTVQQEYESFEQTPGAGDILKRSATSRFQTLSLPDGSPRIDSILPSRAVAGGELTLLGSGFSPSGAGNAVTVQGDTRLSATVIEAASNSLKIRLPDNSSSGAVRVETAGKASNNYNLDVIFAPRPALTLGSLGGGAETTLRLNLTQKKGELGFLEFKLSPSRGTWRTGGFTAGAIVGTLKIGSTTYDLKVKSSESAKLLLDVVEQGGSVPAFSLELNNSGTPFLFLTSTPFPDTVELQSAFSLQLEFTQPVFRLPSGAGVAFDIQMDFVSMPERIGVRGTAHQVSRKQSFTTS